MTAPSTGAGWTCPDCDGEFPADHPAVRALIAEAAAKAWDEGYSKGNLDGYFGTSDEWRKRHPEDGGR